MTTLYKNLRELLDDQDAETPYQFGRSNYKYTACGPWTVFYTPNAETEPGGLQRDSVYYESKQANCTDWIDSCTGIGIGSIVEGSDVNVDPINLTFPFTDEDLDKAISDVNEEACFYWDRDNSQYYSVNSEDGTHLFYCQWIDGDDYPQGTFDDKDLEFAKRCGEALFDSGEDEIQFEGFVVKAEDTPDITF